MGLDYYRVLFLPRDASEAEIKQAYKKMSLLHHPKRQRVERPITPTYHAREQIIREQKRRMDSIQMFHIVGEAYDVLGNPLHRAIYDSYGERGLKEGLPAPTGFIPPYSYHGDPNRTFREFFGTDNPFADILASACVPVDFFASGESSGGFKAKDGPISRPLDVTLEELYTGCLKKVMICKKVLSPDGNSLVPHDKVLTISIQPGTPDGTMFTFPSEGDQGRNVQPADITFTVRTAKHATFVRDGDDLIYNTSATLCQALTGLIIPIHTLDGRTFNIANVHIIRPGYEKIIPNEGMPIYAEGGERRGNLIIRFSLKYPNTLTQSQKKIAKDALDCGKEDELKKKSAAGGKDIDCYTKKQPKTLILPDTCFCPPPEPEQVPPPTESTVDQIHPKHIPADPSKYTVNINDELSKYTIL